ncbi:MAG: DUF1861 family protein [Candidatus Nanoarchaeia archaeon]
MAENKPKTIKSLLAAYHPENIKKVKKLNFEGIQNNIDIYNITAPFKIKRTQYILGRVELRDFEIGSLSVFFYKQKHKRIWRRCKDSPVFNLQDPFRIRFNGQIIIGGVEIEQKSVEKGLDYRTVFYKGRELNKLRRCAKGPRRMKGIRFKKIGNKKIAVFTRPQGKKGGRGKIGFEILDSLNKLTPQHLRKAKIIDNMFAKGEWGGVNDIHILKDGNLGVLGHIAKFVKDKDGKKRYYYPITFKFNPETREFSGMKILVCRSDLPAGDSKRPDLYNVIYPGGIIRNKQKGEAKLYAGVSDAESYEITIKDPFKEYEKEESVQ